MWEHLEVRLDHIVRRKTFCGWEIRPRYITNYELVLILKGKGNISINNDQFEVHGGDLICFRPGIKHSLSATEEPCMEFYGVHFTLPEGMDSIPLPDRMHLDSDRQVELLLKSALEAYRQRGTMAKWRQNLLMQQILYEIFAAMQTKVNPINKVRVQKVLDYIHKDPFREMNLGELLNLAGTGKTIFLEQFRNVTGLTPMQYITTLRLETARDLLVETNMPVAQIGERCGFSDPFYFSRCFKKQYTLSPMQYRSSHVI